MRAMIVVAAVLGVACGPNFGGDFRGTLSVAETCSDGSGQNVSGPGDFQITDRGGQLTIIVGGACDPLTAKAAGNSATIAAKTCPDQTTGGVTLRQSIISGSLTLTEPTLAVSLSLSQVFSGAGPTLTCSDLASGSLVRQTQ